MKNILTEMKKHILLTTFLFVLLFILLCIILNVCGIMFRQWVYYLVIIMIVCGIVVGTIQTRKNSKKKPFKILMTIILILAIIGIILSSWLIYLVLIFSYTPEHIIEKNNKKYVAYVKSFTHVNVYYYDYINFFVVGNKVKIKEYYGSGGYDPFDGEHDSNKPNTYYYYNNDGKVIDTNSEIYIQNHLSDSEIRDLIINNENSTSSSQDSNIYWINDTIAYKVEIVGSAMGKDGIKIYRTDNSGESWNSQLTADDGMMSLHYNSKFAFFEDNLSFIYDPGRAGVETEKGKLMVSTNNSKTYIPCVIELPKTFDATIHIDGLPTYENNELKLKVYSIDYKNNSTKIHYNYTSEDGITWLYKSN